MARDFQVVIDCTDPDRMAAFWAAALDYQLEPPGADCPTWREYQVVKGHPEDEQVDFAAVRDPVSGRRICFLGVPEDKRVKNRVHLDITAGNGKAVTPEEVDALVALLCGLGASALRTGRERGQYFVTMADVEGNEFCIH